MKKSTLNKILFIIFLIIVIMLLCKNTEFLRNCSPEQIKVFINSFGSIAPIIYIILFALVPLTFFPDSVLAIASGMAFGLVKGTIYTMIGALIGGSLAYFIAYYLGKDVILKLTKNKHKLDFLSKGHREFYSVLILRLIPLVPFDIISYGSGLSGIKYKNFLAATAIGIIPGVVIFSNLGDKSLDFKSPEFLIAILLLVLLFALSLFFKKKLLAKKQIEN